MIGYVLAAVLSANSNYAMDIQSVLTCQAQCWSDHRARELEIVHELAQIHNRLPPLSPVDLLWFDLDADRKIQENDAAYASCLQGCIDDNGSGE
jgi:hypothetical protein